MISATLHNILRENPIVVSGMGAICAAGANVGQLWAHALRGQSTPIEQHFCWGTESWQTAVHAVEDLDALLRAHPRARKLDRSIQLALIAADEALQQAGLAFQAADEGRTGLIVGSSRGPRMKWMEAIERRKVLPTDAASSTIASLTGSLAKVFGLTGPSFTVSATCASGAVAIGLAAQQILTGAADRMLVGATDAPLHPMMVAQLRAAGVLGEHPDPTRTCRPFDLSRNGLCLGEGAGFIVLESAASAASRGAPSLACLTGWSSGAENVGRAAVSTGGEALVRTMRQAIDAAGLCPSDISYINAHGTGTLMNDSAEAQAVLTTFGSAAAPPCSSTKPVTGHCLGATPVLEAVLCVRALQEQMIPPTANCHAPAFPLDFVPLQARPAALRHVLSNSLGFWGKHASLLFSR